MRVCVLINSTITFAAYLFLKASLRMNKRNVKRRRRQGFKPPTKAVANCMEKSANSNKQRAGLEMN